MPIDTLLQIVPTLPPSLSGIGDYATLLARELLAAHGVGTRFVVGDPAWRGNEAAVAPFPAETVAARTATALWQALGNVRAADDSETPVLLHYVGYGYAPRGCPFWLVDAVEQWKRQRPHRRLIVLFHETYGSGPVWSSAFWTHPFQRSLAGRLGRLADVRRMTTGPAADELRPMLGKLARQPGAADVTPVFSTLGEPANLPPFSERARQMIVFGSRSWRVEAYTVHAGALTAACRRLGIERIVDVGAPVDIPSELTLPVRAMGALPAEEARALFAGSLAGFFTYPVPFLGKSTIFAAYCSCGLIPVTQGGNHAPSPDGLRAGEHYLFADAEGGEGWENPGAVAAAAHRWYREHRLEIHARGIREQMQAADAA